MRGTAESIENRTALTPTLSRQRERGQFEGTVLCGFASAQPTGYNRVLDQKANNKENRQCVLLTVANSSAPLLP